MWDEMGSVSPDDGPGLSYGGPRTRKQLHNQTKDYRNTKVVKGKTSVNSQKVKSGLITITGGAVATVAGGASVLTGVGVPVGVTAMTFGIATMGFGLAQTFEGLNGGKRKVPGGPAEAVDWESGGDGTWGQLIDLLSGGFPRNAIEGAFFAYGLYGSNAFQFFFLARPSGQPPMRSPFITRRDNTTVVPRQKP